MMLRVNKQAIRRHGRPGDAPEDHSPMDGAFEGQATDARAGHGLRQKERRAEQVSAWRARAVRQSDGMAVVARRQVVMRPRGRSDKTQEWRGQTVRIAKFGMVHSYRA